MAFNTALFARMPKNKIGHSLYKRPKVHGGTMMHGDIVPIYCKLVSPGEVIKEKVYGNIRMSNPITPVYSGIKISANAFFVPIRLLWTHYKEFTGDPGTGTTSNVGNYTIPQRILNSKNFAGTQVKVHSVSHYLNKPLYKGTSVDSGDANSKGKVSVLKERAYWAIINRWYRHEQVQNPIIINTGDGEQIGTKGGVALGFDASPQKCLKDFDYFTTMTRYPQFGPDVALPMAGTAPVIGADELHSLTGKYYYFNTMNDEATGNIYPLNISSSGKMATTDSGRSEDTDHDTVVDKSNLVADLASATMTTIDELYLAMAAQAWYHNANYGARYFEQLEIHYSVTNPDLVLQDPEHIGEAKRFITVQQVLSTAGATSDSTTKLGQPGANSSTNIEFEFPRHAFGEWGYFMILVNTYHERYYTAGVLKEDLYKDLFDFFYPEFSNIGDVGVLLDELYYTSSNSADRDEIVGFQEAWAEMRYSPNQLSGLLDPYAESGVNSSQNALSGWVLSEKWSSAPSFSEEFLLENRNSIKDLLVTGENGPDYLFFFDFDEKTLNEVPLYSVPGLPGRGRGLI